MAKARPTFWSTRTSLASTCCSIGKASPLFFRASRSRQPHEIHRLWRRGRARTRPFSASCFSPRSALPNNVMEKHMGKTREDGVRNGQAAWNTLEKNYSSHTKEARRAYYEQLHNTKMKCSDDPDDLLNKLGGYRERLENVGQPAPDERYDDINYSSGPSCQVREGPQYQLCEAGYSPGRHLMHHECSVHRLPLPSEQIPLGRMSWGCQARDRGKRQHNKRPLVWQSGIQPEQIALPG